MTGVSAARLSTRLPNFRANEDLTPNRAGSKILRDFTLRLWHVEPIPQGREIDDEGVGAVGHTASDHRPYQHTDTLKPLLIAHGPQIGEDPPDVQGSSLLARSTVVLHRRVIVRRSWWFSFVIYFRFHVRLTGGRLRFRHRDGWCRWLP